MRSLALIATVAFLGAAAQLSSGCTNSASGIETGSNAPIATAPSVTEANPDPLARAAQVASTVARGQKCGLNFDAAKVRALYLGYEGKQGAGGSQLAKIEKAYDASFSASGVPAAGSSNFCSAQESAEIKRSLERYRAGFFTPRTKTDPANEPMDLKKFWKDQDDG